MPAPPPPTKSAQPQYVLGKVLAVDTHRTLWSFDDSQVAGIASDETLLVIVDQAHQIVAHRLSDGHVVWTHPWPHRPAQIELVAAGVAVLDGTRLSLLGHADGVEIHTTDLGEAPRQVTFSGALAAVTTEQDIVFVELATGHVQGAIAISDHPVKDLDIDDIRRRFGSAAPSDAPFAFVSRPPQISAFERGFVIVEPEAAEHPSTHVIVVGADGRKALETSLVGPGLNAPIMISMAPHVLGFVTASFEPWAQLIRLPPRVQAEPPVGFHVDAFVGDEPVMLRVENSALVASVGSAPRFRVADAFPTWDANHVLEAVQLGDTIAACAYATAAPDTVVLGIDAGTGAVRYRVSLPISRVWARRPFELRRVTVEPAGDNVIVTREEIDGIAVDLLDAKTGQTWYHDEHAWH